MYEDCLVKITGGKHAISLSELAKLPNELNDPILLFKGSVPNSFVALTEMKMQNGHNAIVAIHINKNFGRQVINKIASIHSRTTDNGYDAIESYVYRNIADGNLLDASIKKAPKWFTSRGLQLPKLVQTIIDANNSILNNSEKVNTNEKNNEKVIKNSYKSNEIDIYDEEIYLSTIDSEGNRLSQEQLEFFISSKVRDEKGNL